MTPSRPEWDFPYQPPTPPAGDGGPGPLDVVVATREAVDAGALREALRDLGDDVQVEPLLARAPLFWSRVRGAARAAPEDAAALLARTRLPVRYVAAARVGSMALPPPLDFTAATAARATDWSTLPARPVTGPLSDGQWFLGDGGGVHVDRAVCGTGAGSRLAVIDDEIADVDQLALDRTECIGVDRAPATTGHAALLIAWATGTAPRGAERFIGVAPDASVRLYCIPKAGIDVVSLPLAVARAVFDGADVVVCSTYVDGTTGPLLDDALEVALRLGRRGRGTVVVLPTGRETSSPGTSVHASLTLGLGDPASDPRVHCVAPGGRKGGWFLWRSRGKLRPFSNRGPAVRWVAPGDDIAYPFSSRDRLFHAESSGAAGIAAGVFLLVLSCNRALRLRDLHAILARTVDLPERDDNLDAPLADPADVLPSGVDADGHNAKCGYGRLNAARACACARDPVALELAAMGEHAAAIAWSVEKHPYSRRFARWAVRMLLARPDQEHAARVLLRHARLVTTDAARANGHAYGALARQAAVGVRELQSMNPPARVREELAAAWESLRTRANAGADDASLTKALIRLFPEPRRRETPSTRAEIPTGRLRS